MKKGRGVVGHVTYIDDSDGSVAVESEAQGRGPRRRGGGADVQGTRRWGAGDTAAAVCRARGGGVDEEACRGGGVDEEACMGGGIDVEAVCRGWGGGVNDEEASMRRWRRRRRRRGGGGRCRGGRGRAGPRWRREGDGAAALHRRRWSGGEGRVTA
ncbi:hypothetical protein PVAP13_2KG265958 [Panicum virgatum]|uniref:Uncharacterized protein n=1 Tax=Panicum virgatum TaxID=38727 RepID=A0A8T0W5Y5_PANVG|nr:hypothetical protein PVAP13_2KG265958 [Panicum virgatum]